MTADLPAGSFVDLSTKESVSLSAGAVADVWSNWHDIDWRSIHQTVRRLQARIVKATKEGKMGRVKALQHLLTHSFSGKALAVKRVMENQTVSPYRNRVR